MYIGQLDETKRHKHGVGVRMYLKESLKGDQVKKEDILRVYEGQWVNDKREGRGFEIYTNRNVYHGLFKDNRRHGQGSYYKVDSGEVYKGQWY